MKEDKQDYKFINLELLRYLQDRQNVSQRELAKEMGISLGRINFLLNALIKKGAIKVRNFKNNQNKLAYAYYLTPTGIKEKTVLTIEFFRRKSAEYDTIKHELERLEKDIKNLKNNKSIEKDNE
jgi:EPS-associated MarR family transcriptional regulator